MNGSGGVDSQAAARVLNAVPLEHAVLCAECDVVSDSPHDTCMVCGSRSLFNIARVFGGKLPKARVGVITESAIEETASTRVLIFPKPHKPRRRTSAGARQLSIVSVDEMDNDEMERGMLLGPKGR